MSASFFILVLLSVFVGKFVVNFRWPSAMSRAWVVAFFVSWGDFPALNLRQPCVGQLHVQRGLRHPDGEGGAAHVGAVFHLYNGGNGTPLLWSVHVHGRARRGHLYRMKKIKSMMDDDICLISQLGSSLTLEDGTLDKPPLNMHISHSNIQADIPAGSYFFFKREKKNLWLCFDPCQFCLASCVRHIKLEMWKFEFQITWNPFDRSTFNMV